MTALDRHLPRFDIHEVHQITIDLTPEDAIDRVLALPVAPDLLVRTLFRVRGLGGLDLSIEDFATDELGLEIVERTSTTVVATGRPRGQLVGISFEAFANPDRGSTLLTETRVANAGVAFRLYWMVVGPFSALIRRRWLQTVVGSVG